MTGSRIGELVGVIDAGTQTIKALIAARTAHGFSIVGVGTSEIRTMGKGAMSPAALGSAMREALSEAEVMARVEIDEVYVVVPSIGAIARQAHGLVSVNGVVTHDDVTRALEAAKQPGPPPEQTYVHAFARSYTVDRHTGIPDPVDLHGRRLEVHALVVSVPSIILDGISAAAQKAGFRIRGFGVSSMCAAYGVTTFQERMDGVVVVDAGYSCTTTALCFNGAFVHLGNISSGANILVNDLGVNLFAAKATAIQVMKRHGAASVDAIQQNEQFEVSGVDGTKSYSRKLIPLIFEPRISDLAREIHRDVDLSNFLSEVRCGVVLCGGLANLSGITSVMEEGLRGISVRIGYPGGAGDESNGPISGYVQVIQSPTYAAAVGMFYALTDGVIEEVSATPGAPNAWWRDLLLRARSFWTRIF